MILELSLKYPWIKKHSCPPPAVLVVPAEIKNPSPLNFYPQHHATWVTVDGKIGWLHSHSGTKYSVQFLDGSMTTTESPVYANPADVPSKGDLGVPNG